MNELEMEPLVRSVAEHYEGNDREFFQRVWANGLGIYKNRLKAIGFTAQQKVLDAGFGTGQWLISLAQLDNKEVHGIEYSPVRVKATEALVKQLNIDNVILSRQSAERTNYPDDTFDAVFCYGVLFLTDYKKTLGEFHRILKPNGRLYFTINGLGWYLFCLIEEHNKSAAYNPRQMAIDAMNNSLSYFNGKERSVDAQLIIPADVLKNDLQDAGFSIVTMAGEGEINLTKSAENKSFYSKKEYLGQPFITEVLAVKN